MVEYIYTAHMTNGDRLTIRSRLDYEEFIKHLGDLRLRYIKTPDLMQNQTIRENPFVPNIDKELGSVVDQEVDYDLLHVINLDQICYLTIKLVV